MLATVNFITNRRYILLALPALALLLGLGQSSGGALASNLTGTTTATQAALPPGPAGAIGPSHVPGSRSAPAPPAYDARLVFLPGTGGSVPAPPNGGSVNVGDRFVLDLWVDGGSNTDLVSQQSFLTFTGSLLQNARVSDLATGCTLTGTVTEDLTTFDTVLKNEVCNGPSPCNFGGVLTDPGSFAFASGGLSTCPVGCAGVFRVARVGFCAVAPGRAVLHWLFANASPVNRDSEVVDINDNIVSDPALFQDYVINIGGTPTPTVTPTIACPGAFHYLAPEAGGPPNGGSVNVGDKFILDMRVSTGSNLTGLVAQQAYISFPHQLLQNVSAIAPGCVQTVTVTPDQTVFDAVLQNEVCNGPYPCGQGVVVPPGSLAYASGTLGNPPYVGPDFRVARIALCAVAPGQATLRWQFAPPDPVTRDTEIVDSQGDIVNVRACYQDYVINITGSTSTPTDTPAATGTITPGGPTLTNTPTITPTRTRTNTPTNTHTRTPTRTPVTTCPPGAYHYLLPEAGAPPNGGTARVGDKLTLDLMVSAGDYTIPAQQTYMTFTSGLLQNVRADVAGCGPTSTLTADTTVFDLPVRNEVCNGPDPCDFHGLVFEPGSIHFDSSVSANPPYSGPDFRVARMAFCATSTGQAIVHWLFSPPAPINRDTKIIDQNNNTVNVRGCYQDYVINILPAINSPTESPTSTRTPTSTNTPTATPTNTPGGPTLTPTNTPCAGTYHYFIPEAGGPPNGGTVSVGDRFTLDMMIAAGAPNLSAQQAYLTFTSGLLQNVRATSAGCVLTGTVTSDLSVFDAALQNEVCNGPGNCNFRGLIVPPGSMAWASGALINPNYTGPDFRVARVGLCAIAPGQAVLHWQFSPPAPPTRDTSISDGDSRRVNEPACYQDYVINITDPDPPPVDTPTSTSTSTSTPTSTNTPACNVCPSISGVTISCNPDGTVHWTATVHNRGNCAVTKPWKVQLQQHMPGNGGFTGVAVNHSSSTFPPGDTVVSGNFCYNAPANVNLLKVEFAIDDVADQCRPHRKSPGMHPCPHVGGCPLAFQGMPGCG